MVGCVKKTFVYLSCQKKIAFVVLKSFFDKNNY